MKIILPSKGVLGIRSVELRPPTFNDVRNVYNLNQQDGLLKAQFVQGLLDNVDFSKITKFDLDYLYLIAGFSLTFNRVVFKINCATCNAEIEDFIMFGDQEVQEWKKQPYPCVKTFDGVEYTYRIMSAQDEISAWEYALTQENETAAYQDACVSLILFGNTEEIERVQKLPASIYVSAIAYQYYNFHGVILKAPCECQKCHTKTRVRINPTADLIRVNLHELMSVYADLSSEVSFDDFCNFTMNEYKAFMDAIKNR